MKKKTSSKYIKTLPKHLHIVSFDIPMPANYGGVIDVFYKLKALSKLGVKIHLHCFFKDRKPVNELKNYCESVHYYKRQSALKSLSSSLPFVVQTRNNKELVTNLKKIIILYYSKAYIVLSLFIMKILAKD